MKKLWPGIIIVAVVVALFFFFSSRKQPEKQRFGNEAMPANVSNAPARLPAPVFASNGAIAAQAGPEELASHAASPNPPPEASATTNEESVLTPAVALDKARIVMQNYRSTFGEDPVGTNPEITAALMGKNAKGINFVAGTGLSVDAKGEMLDGYGTPFFFHQISGQEMEIRSAGPDHVMWNADDLVTR